MKKIKIAVMNTSREITDVLSELMREIGFETCDMFTYKFKRKEVDFEEFVESNKPHVIIYDIALPYKENFQLFKELSAKEVVKNIPFLLTTTNKHVLEQIVGKTNAFEIVGKPYDLEELAAKARKIVNKA